MKKLILSVLVLATIATITGFSMNNKPATNQTEEYAIMEAKLYLRNGTFSVSTTIGGQRTTYDVFYTEKKQSINWAPILKKMHELNTQGFELLNTSISVMESDDIYRYKYHSYTFVRKVE